MGKLTVKHFLNKKVRKLKAIEWDEEGSGECYALYVRMIVNRRNIEIKSRSHKIELGLFKINPYRNQYLIGKDRMGLFVNEQIYLTKMPKVENEDTIEVDRDRKRIIKDAILVMDIEKQSLSDAYNYYSKTIGSDFHLTHIPEIDDIIFSNCAAYFNKYCVEKIKEVFRKDEKYRVVAEIISNHVDYDDLTSALDSFSSFKSDFEAFYEKHNEALSEAKRMFDSFLTLKHFNNITIMTWVANGYYEEMEENIDRWLLDSDYEDISLIKFYIKHFQNSVKEKIDNAYPQVFVEAS